MIETVRYPGNSVQKAVEYLGLPFAPVQAALDYYADHRVEVDDIADRERVSAEAAEAASR